MARKAQRTSAERASPSELSLKPPTPIHNWAPSTSGPICDKFRPHIPPFRTEIKWNPPDVCDRPFNSCSPANFLLTLGQSSHLRQAAESSFFFSNQQPQKITSIDCNSFCTYHHRTQITLEASLPPTPFNHKGIRINHHQRIPKPQTPSH